MKYRRLIPTALLSDGPAFAFWLDHEGYAAQTRVLAQNEELGWTYLEVTILVAT
jgi:hypothetical protein